MNTESNDFFSLEVCEHDEDLKRAFSIAGRGRFLDDDLAAIGGHTFVLYLVNDDASIDTTRKMLHATNGLLKAGGLAVKIDSTGTAHRRDSWAALCKEDSLRSLLEAYVTYIGGPGAYYSCGMHNLGFPDAVVEAPISPKDAAVLLHTFLGYVLFENPKLNDRETFSIDSDAPRYRLFREPCSRYEPGDLFHNPLGVWKMVPA